MIHGIIFDMDGVIIDSNTFHYNNWNGYFQDNFNVTIPKEDFGMKLGESHKHFTEYFAKKYASKADLEKIKVDVINRYIKYRETIPLKKGVRETLKNLKQDYKIALASGGRIQDVKHILELHKIKQYFDFAIGGDEVKRSKPNPEIFLNAAAGLNLKPDECVVIEDALMGLMAAKSAGMKCIMVEDEITKNQNHENADAKIKSFLELPNILKNI